MRLAAVLLLAAILPAFAGERDVKDLSFFLRRLRAVDHLPELEPSHTAMASTWDRSGGNRDGVDFKQIEGNRNILLDVDGPGCLHRLFTGKLGEKVAGTRLRIFLDHGSRPVFDLPVDKFFDDKEGPIPYPLVFHKTYPGTLFPIPFAEHCRVELQSDEPDPARRQWGNFWQLTYTRYPPGAPVRSLRWPLNQSERNELDRVRRAWLDAESHAPAAPPAWSREERLSVAPGREAQISLDGTGVVREIRMSVNPPEPEVLRGLRFQAFWDGAASPSIDVPLGYFFGHADHGHSAEAQFSSLLMGVTDKDAWCRLPMPFARGARFRLLNRAGSKADITMRIDLERGTPPANWGRLHATWTEQAVWEDHIDRLPRFGNSPAPVHVVLDSKTGPGKYVGALLHVAWPHKEWWGEGDWLIWTDEDAWPPSYHGTGSEEYFNSGWCRFDRKAVSGFIHQDMPGDVSIYTLHLNDAFQFRRNARVAVEIWPQRTRYGGIWGSTAFWYALPAQSAGSRSDLFEPRRPPPLRE